MSPPFTMKNCKQGNKIPSREQAFTGLSLQLQMDVDMKI
jgi:hypothetical protein